MLRSVYMLAAVVALAWVPTPRARAQELVFERGDANTDKRVDIADPIFLLSYIFSGGKAPACKPIANANGDSHVDISDAITILSYLFSNPVPLPPLTQDEIAECNGAVPPPPPTAVRHGSFQDVIDPPHGVVGSRVEQLSDHTIRLTNFNYDALGFPAVRVLLTILPFSNEGIVISGDLLRDHPYINETMVLPLPAAITDDQFGYVSIWCDYFPLTYAIAKLYDGPSP